MKNIVKEITISWELLKRFSRQHLNMLLVQIIVFSAITCYNALISPYIMGQIFYALEIRSIERLYVVCSLGAAGIGIFFIACFVNNTYLDMNSFKISVTCAKNVCMELYRLPYDKVSKKYEEAEIHNRIDTCANSISGVFPLIVLILSNIISMGALLIMAGALSAVLLIVVAATVFAGISAAKYEMRRTKVLEKERQTIEDKCSESMYQMIHQMPFLSIYGAEAREFEKYQSYREQAWNIKRRQEKVSVRTVLLTNSISSLCRTALGGALYPYYQKQILSSDQVASSFSIYDQLSGIAGNFSFPFRNISAVFVGAKRLEELLSVKAGSPLLPGAETMVELDNVAYTAEDRYLIKEITLGICQGEKIAVIGANGSGKSTLLRVMCGLYTPSMGSVKIRTDQKGAERFFSYIPSSSYLYAQSVESNIRMNEFEVQEDLREAVSLAAFQHSDQPIQLEAIGTCLSGGQAQRVNIARGILRKAPILLADEPGGGLPQKQGQAIVENILNHMETVVIVTHHKQQLPLFSRIILMENGKIAADGNFEDVKKTLEYNRWLGNDN